MDFKSRPGGIGGPGKLGGPVDGGGFSAGAKGGHNQYVGGVVARPWMTNARPLDLSRYKHKIPKDTKNLPIYPRETLGITFKEHLENFSTFYKILAIDHEDITIRMLVQTLTKEALHYYNYLLSRSITYWDDLTNKFFC